MKVLNDLAKSEISWGQIALVSWPIFFRHQTPDITNKFAQVLTWIIQ